VISAVWVAFARWEGGGAIQAAHLLLAGVVLAAATGHADGARLARRPGSWWVISWALAFSAPLLFLPTVLASNLRLPSVSWSAWAGFAHVRLVSMFLRFFAWCRGRALGGIAAVGQTPLQRPFLATVAPAWLLDERIDAAGLVVAAIALGRES
jgi:drug/metabolite transporter (DMT)-like permease